jgi:hypothetical protein
MDNFRDNGSFSLKDKWKGDGFASGDGNHAGQGYGVGGGNGFDNGDGSDLVNYPDQWNDGSGCGEGAAPGAGSWSGSGVGSKGDQSDSEGVCAVAGDTIYMVSTPDIARKFPSSARRLSDQSGFRFSKQEAEAALAVRLLGDSDA